jgi:hypothetical protein
LAALAASINVAAAAAACQLLLLSRCPEDEVHP